uniref:Uncharacterized protein n=1 Tax=Arundo donax TaxID=35708 RepID=A0A0A9JRZ8_ARUDO
MHTRNGDFALSAGNAYVNKGFRKCIHLLAHFPYQKQNPTPCRKCKESQSANRFLL